MSNQPTPRYLCPTPVPLELFETVVRLLKRTHLLSGIRAFRGSQMFAHLHAHKYIYIWHGYINMYIQKKCPSAMIHFWNMFKRWSELPLRNDKIKICWDTHRDMTIQLQVKRIVGWLRSGRPCIWQLLAFGVPAAKTSERCPFFPMRHRGSTFRWDARVNRHKF